MFFSIVMFDIDYFKKINDRYGYVLGDEVIVNMVCIFKLFVR